MHGHQPDPKLVHVAERFPRTAGALIQAHNDLKYAQNWADIKVGISEGAARGYLTGCQPNQNDAVFVVPCDLADSLSMSWVKSVFADLGSPPSIYLAICTEDSSLVYYRISSGFTKPPL